MISPLSLRVLAIDDDELVLGSFLSLARFSNPCWEVRTASEHGIGLDIARGFVPHVICADIERKPQPGLWLAENIRRHGQLRNVFLIAITGCGDARIYGEIEAAGFDVRLTKPVGYQLFIQHLQAFALARSLLR